MRASEMRTTAEELLKDLENAKAGGWRDPNMVKFKMGEDGKWGKNILRPIGNFRHAKVHYLMDYINEGDDLDRLVICPGSNICPSCQMSKYYHNIGDEDSKRIAWKFKASDRHYWNVLPRDSEYEYGEDGKRFLVLSFGNGTNGTCIDSLMDILQNHGNAADIDEGYDIIYMARKKKNTTYGEYKFSVVTERSKVGGRSGVFVTSKTLSKSEKALEVVDLEQYVTPIDDDQISLLDDILQVQVFGEGKKKRRETFSEDDDDLDEDEDEDDLSYEDDEEDTEGEKQAEEDWGDEDEEDLLCFADTEVYDSEVAECTDCPSFVECGKEVKRVRMAKARRRKRRA